MYETKVPGTRYSVALANVKGQWMIQIKLDGIVESEIVLKELSERGILENVRSIVKDVNLYLNDFMIDQISKEITVQAQMYLQDKGSPAQEETYSEMSAIEETLIGIVKRIEQLEDRVKKLELTRALQE